MKYEIINPSDQCFLKADDDKIAAACVLFIGEGMYGCRKTETGETLDGVMVAFGGDVEEKWTKTYGIGFHDFISDTENRKKMLDCFASFSYAGEPGSLNDIGARAKSLENGLRKALSRETIPSP